VPTNQDVTLSGLDRALDGVEGWFSPEQVARVVGLASRVPATGRIVEIGSFRGRSTIVLASAAPAGTEVVAIDPHAGTDRGPGEIAGHERKARADRTAFEQNLAAAGVAERVRHVRAFSEDARGLVDGPVDLVYVDGAHRYGPARADLRGWGARVRPGGTLLVHDAFSSVGVTLAIVRELVAGRRFRYVGRTASLAEYRADLDARERLSNAARQLLQLPWFARNLALKVLLTLGWGTLMRRLGRPAPEWPY
jgi:predicted O-methyltransferase YrrM